MCTFIHTSRYIGNTSSYGVYRQLHSNRPPLPDVPAVYFVSPTMTNIRRIAQDLEKGLYESFHLNFVEPLPRALLEELAAAVARDGTGEFVEQVCSKYICRPPFTIMPNALRFSTNTFHSLPHLLPYSRFFHLQRQHPHLLRTLRRSLVPHNLTQPMYSSTLRQLANSRSKKRLSVSPAACSALWQPWVSVSTHSAAASVSIRQYVQATSQ